MLDVATQQGGFIHIFMEVLRNYREIVGIDIDAQAVRQPRRAFDEPSVRFMHMDAERMGLASESFDTVCVSASLHHLMRIDPVMREMDRVLKPGGVLVLAEMHCNARTEAQRTSVGLHHWIAEVDTSLGGIHHATLSRQSIVESVERLQLRRMTLYDSRNPDSDPMDPSRIVQLEALIDRTLERLIGAGRNRTLEDRGEALRQQLRSVGAQSEPVLLVIGEKRGRAQSLSFGGSTARGADPQGGLADLQGDNAS